MNPCFWLSTGMCKCEGCHFESCEDFIDMNSPRGREVDEIYRMHIREALEPVRKRMKLLFRFKEKIREDKILLKGEYDEC